MQVGEIKVGRTYRGKDGSTRTATAILCGRVQFRQDGKLHASWDIGAFARWAVSEVPQ
jgi:hypothetical protein